MESTQVITDLRSLAMSCFAHAFVESMDNRSLKTPATLIGFAVCRAVDLRTAFIELHQCIDPADPEFPLLESILAVLK
jgi:hypothetical protein